MSNEQFNKLTVRDMGTDILNDITAMIPVMNQTFHRMETFQLQVIQSMTDTVRLAIANIGPLLFGGPLNTAGGSSTTPTNIDYFGGRSRFTF